MYFSDLVCLTRVEKDTLRSGSLTSIDVGDDTDIPKLFHVSNNTCHNKLKIKNIKLKMIWLLFSGPYLFWLI
jgi:hypothetical protein